jgi:cytochrome oxidase Cu insertion factor (SCO1/SenC/PrrC family)
VVRDIAAQFPAVFFKGMPTDSVGGYNVEHTSQVYLVDKGGRLRATFYNAPTDDMIAVTRGVLSEEI